MMLKNITKSEGIRPRAMYMKAFKSSAVGESKVDISTQQLLNYCINNPVK